MDDLEKEADSRAASFGLHPKRHPLGDDHHTDIPLNDADKAIGDALAWYLGGLFIDVEDDRSYFYTKMTSVDAWSRVCRALRIHGLRIVDDC